MFYFAYICLFLCFSGKSGKWSTDGCSVSGRRDANGEKYVTCTCNHLSSFGVLMDISNIEVKTTLFIFQGSLEFPKIFLHNPKQEFVMSYRTREFYFDELFYVQKSSPHLSSLQLYAVMK